MTPRRMTVAVAVLLLCAASAMPAMAQGLDQRARSPAISDAQRTVTRSIALPARGLFNGDQLSASARSQLTELVIEARGLDIEVALVVPSGPWQIDGGGDAERRLTPARLDAIRTYLAQRGIDPKRIYVESRIDPKLAEPQLLIELVGRPGRE